MSETELEVLLPQSEAELDAFVTTVTETYGLPAGDATYDSIATMILHLPATRAFAPMSYFGNGVRKQIANKYAYEKLAELKHKRDAAEKARMAEEEAKNAEITPTPATLELVGGESV